MFMTHYEEKYGWGTLYGDYKALVWVFRRQSGILSGVDSITSGLIHHGVPSIYNWHPLYGLRSLSWCHTTFARQLTTWRNFRLLWLQLLRPMVSTCVGLRQKQAVALCCVSCLSQNQIAQKSKVKRYSTTTVCVLICSDAFWIEGCFLGYFFFFSMATAVWMGVSGRHLYSSGGFSRLDIPMPYILRIYTAEKNLEQTNTPIVYTNIIPNMQCLPPPARWTVGGVTAGYKNAYSSFFMVGPQACSWSPGAGARTRARARAGSAPGCYVKSASAATTLRKAASHI